MMDGKLYMDGVLIGEVKETSITAIETDDPEELKQGRCVFNHEMTVSVKIDPLSILSLLYGRKITNNWLKMRGGVMIRQCGKHRRKKWRR